MRFGCLLLCLLLLACGDDSASVDSGVDSSAPDSGVDADTDAGTDAGVSREFEFGDPPIDPGVPVQFATVAYGDNPAQLIDVWVPESEAPTAMVVFFHGGGFVGGSRESGHAGEAVMLRSLLAAGVAWAGVDYRFLTDPSSNGVRSSLEDSRRGLQFLRFHAETLNIDPTRIGLVGGSAGAGTSLWLALHDEMADPDDPDPVARMSTRASVVTVWETQATYDLLRWPSDVFSPTHPMTAEDLVENPGLAAQAALFYGLPLTLASDPEGLLEALRADDLTTYREGVDMLALMSSDDPPLYVFNADENIAPGEGGFDILHHPLHAMALRARAEEEGVPFEGLIPAFEVSSETGTVEHLLNVLTP
ncbi:MAG: alpha/beta hydrolase fold domain-containing protein [Myxococcota bacterium]